MVVVCAVKAALAPCAAMLAVRLRRAPPPPPQRHQRQRRRHRAPRSTHTPDLLYNTTYLSYLPYTYPIYSHRYHDIYS